MLEAEFVDELRNKRFGLSDTVYTQIKRYTEAVRRNQRTAQEEAVALAKLIGRRPDAEAVLRAAGRFLAREAYMTVSPVTRGMLHVHPGARRAADGAAPGAAHRAAVPQRQRAARGHLAAARDAALDHRRRRRRASVGLRVLRGDAARAAAAARRHTGSVEHTRCEGRGEGSCEWRADWRGADRSHAQAA